LATVPIIGKYFKWAKPLAKSSKVLTSVPIKDISGMPAWFKPLVNKVIKEGKEIESGAERVITHKTKLPNSKTDVYVEQDLVSGDVSVQIGTGKHGWSSGQHGQPVSLQYTAPQHYPTHTEAAKIDAFRKPATSSDLGLFRGTQDLSNKKTKPEFWVEEAEFTGGHPENVKFDDSTFEKFGSHGSNFDEVEMFATGKVKKTKPLKKRELTEWESGKAEADADRWADDLDMASGGRVPLREAGEVMEMDEWYEDPDIIEEILKALKDRTREGLGRFQTGGRVPMFGGGAAKAAWRVFIERLFIKTSNDIRLGKRLFKDLTGEQRWIQHDNLTRMAEQFRKTGKFNKGANQYFGIDAEKAFAEVEAKVKAQKYADEMDAEMWDAGRDAVDSLTGKKEVLKRVKMGDKAAIKEKIKRDERAMIKAKYPGITDDLLNKILIDDNPQRKAEVLATLDQYFELGKRGKSMEEASEIVKQGIRHRTKQAEGGRVPMIFGGSPGLKAMWQMILKNISKGKKKPIKKLFPKPTVQDKELLKMGETYNLPGAKSWSAQEHASKLEGIDHIIARLKQDKKILERQAANKAMKDEGLDFLMKQIERDMPDVYGPHLKKYTNIDKDILQMETIKKNLIMKDRKLNASGGLAGMLGE
jgi:hypothetical protein